MAMTVRAEFEDRRVALAALEFLYGREVAAAARRADLGDLDAYPSP
jgi:hypothetical protein